MDINISSEDKTNKNDQRIYYNILKRVGAYGNYQINFLRIIYAIATISASTFFILPYILYQQSYSCPDYEGNCSKMVCQLPIAQRNQFLPSPLIKSIANSNTDMHCDNNNQMLYLQQMFLIGTSVGIFIGIIFIQFLGKNMLISISLIFTTISVTMVLFIESYYLKGIGLFIWGTGSQVSFSILTNLITEQISEERRLGQYVWMSFWFTFGFLVNCTVFFIFKNWELVLGIYFLPVYILITVCFIYYVESTPLELISRHSPESAFKAFMRIAQRNQVTDHGLTYQQIARLQQQYKQNKRKKHNYTFNFFDLLKYSSVRKDFLVLSLIFFVFMFQLYGTAFLMNQLNLNIFVLGYLNIGTQFIGLIFIKELVINYRRKKSLIVLFSTASIFLFISYALAPNDCFNCNKGWKLFFTLLSFALYSLSTNIGGSLFQSSLNQTFPAQIRSLSIYSIVGIARFSTLLIPYQTKLKNQYGISILLQFALMSLLSVLGAVMMKQTWNTVPQQILLELKDHQGENIEH